MPKLAHNRDNNRYYLNDGYSRQTYEGRIDYSKPQSTVRSLHSVNFSHVDKRSHFDSRNLNRGKFLHRLILAIIATIFAITVLPYGIHNVTKSFWRHSKYPKVKTDYKYLVNPTVRYLANDWYIDRPLIGSINSKKPLMTPIKEGAELVDLENELRYLSTKFSSIHPGIYVYDIDNGDYAGINSDEIFATASIIKLPVLVQLFKSVEAGQLTLNEKMSLSEYFRTEGSGELQFKAANSTYTIDELARRMITDSDNSATNMLVAKLGSMTDINSALRQWGIPNTFIKTWLPDLSGTNKTTAKDMATILYNLENKDFLSDSSREKIFDYMGNVRNTRLLKSGLPNEATLLHKTGDIGKMLGDAGIVYTPENKRYIVVVLANRPHNSPQGREFIVNASSVIYNYMVNKK